MALVPETFCDWSGSLWLLRPWSATSGPPDSECSGEARPPSRTAQRLAVWRLGAGRSCLQGHCPPGAAPGPVVPSFASRSLK